jgi:hypothetical protein
MIFRAAEMVAFIPIWQWSPNTTLGSRDSSATDWIQQ